MAVGAKRDPKADDATPATAFHNRAVATMIDNFAFFVKANTLGEARAKEVLAARQKQKLQVKPR